jgi:hypothetical protein
MTRPGFFLILCATAAIIVGSLSIAANPGGETRPSIENALVVQQATVVARDYLLHGESKKAVEILEANLSRINGDRKYLNLLRDAYRAYVQQLSLARQPVLLDVYKKRLQILEDFDTSVPAEVPVAKAAPTSPKANAAAEKVAKAPAGVAQPNPQAVAAKLPEKAPVPAVVRARAADPFDAANEIKGGPVPLPQPSAGKDLLVKADSEFAQKRYATAKLLYEQAFQADTRVASEEARRCWAYCQLSTVADQINQQTGGSPGDWGNLESQVQRAVEVAPHLAKTGEYILGEMQKRKVAAAPVDAKPATVASAVAVQHLPKAANGMLVAQTAHFRVYHNQAPEFAEKVARVAEETRLQMARKWFNKDEEDWQPKCDIYLHACAADYSRNTEQSINSPGHSKIELDRSTGRVVLRQIHLRCDNPALLESVLPHEATHVVLGGQFGNQHVPRWVDEGIAVLTEPAEKVQQHRKNLLRSLQNRELIPLRDLVQLDQYPKASQVTTFYAQSVALVDFLTKQKTPVVFTQFVRDSLRDGFEPALRTHYGIQDIGDLQDRFTQRILAESQGNASNNAENVVLSK